MKKKLLLKKIFKVLTIACFLFSFVPSLSLSAVVKPETFVYGVQYLWFIPIGEIKISSAPYMLDKQDIYQLSATYHSGKWLSIFYPIQGKSNSYIDSRTLLPVRYEEFYSYPWHDDVNTVLVYDQERKRVYIDRNGEKETKGTFEKTLDPLSSLFFFRSVQWRQGMIRTFNLNNHQNNYKMSVVCLGAERLNDRNVWKLHAVLRKYDKERSESDKEFLVWLTRDHTKLPIRVKVESKYGPLTMSLKH